MRVQKVRHNAGYEFTLLDDEGLAIPLVSNFLGYLRARGCSPNTLCAYAHDLQHFYRFLKGASIQIQEFTPSRLLKKVTFAHGQRNSMRVVQARNKGEKTKCAETICSSGNVQLPLSRATSATGASTASDT